MARLEDGNASEIFAIQGPSGMRKNDERHFLQQADYHLANSGCNLGAKGKARMGLELVAKFQVQILWGKFEVAMILMENTVVRINTKIIVHSIFLTDQVVKSLFVDAFA